jgi:hypothetical protein
LVSSVYGSSEDMKEQKRKIETFAKEKGYVTGFSNNMCQTNEMDHEYKAGYTTNEKFEDDETCDHEMVQIACDYNNVTKEVLYTETHRSSRIQ